MSTPAVSWDEPGQNLDAYPSATLALDREAWEALGAQFRAVDDGQGETPHFATGSVPTRGGAVAIGVLDYGEDTTYLLVSGDADRRAQNTAEVLTTLSHAGAIRLDDDVVDLSRPARPNVSLEQRIDDLERQVRLLLDDRPSDDDSASRRSATRATAIEASRSNVIVLGSPEHTHALGRANEVRLARAELKRNVAAGRTTVGAVMLGCPREAASMTIAELLTSQRRWGSVRTSKFLAGLGISGSKTIGEFTDRQRRSLAAMI